MTSAGSPSGDHEAINHFLKLHGKDLELQGFKLAGCYSIDLHELLSRTAMTVWEKWSSEFYALPDDERYKCTLRILANHARNLSRNARRDEKRCDYLSGAELERLVCTITTYQDPVAVETIFEDERFMIYKAISQLDGRCRDVMTRIALRLENDDIRKNLGITVTNLTSTKMRARRLLREILGVNDKHAGGELR